MTKYCQAPSSVGGCHAVVCQFVCQSCLLLCVKLVLSLAYDTFCLRYDLILSVSIMLRDISTPADMAKRKHTWSGTSNLFLVA